MTVENIGLNSLRQGRAMLASLLIGLLTAPATMAGPEGGEVVRGDGNIIRTDSTTTTINQFTNNMVIDWTSFNVAASETVNYVQPNSSATALNQIWDQNASTILGSINANGRVILVNPNGILFGSNASVDVGALIASGLSIDTDDFMDGQLAFANPDGSTGGMVVNHGLLQAADGGSVNLFGGAVSNTGTIIANYGAINLAAGKQVTIDFDGDGLLQFAVDGAVLDNANGVDSAVANSGTLAAQGGTILLSANAARDVFTQVVNNEGVIAANGVTEDGGRVFLTGRGGNVVNSGTVSADSVEGNGGSVHIESDADTFINDGEVTATSRRGSGGDIQVLGNRVALLGDAVIDASGATGGGQVNIGGAYQGGSELPSAEATVIAPDVVISANATDVGDGGVVIVWADGVTRFHGNIFARGGANGGDGGFVETSGKDYLESFGSVDATATAGAAGTWLLDPRDITIDTVATSGGSFDSSDPNTFTPTSDDAIVDVADIVASLDGGTSVVITTGSTGTQNGDITIAAAINTSTPSLVTLQLDAARDIIVDAGVSDSGSGLNLDFNAGRNVDVNAAMSTGAGFIDLHGATGGITVDGVTGGGSTLTTTSGAITLTAGGGAIVDSNNETGGTGANIATGSGVVTLSATGDVGTAGGGSEDFDLSGVTDLVISSGGEIGITNDTTLASLDLTMTSVASIGNPNDASIVSTGLTFNIDEDGGDLRINQIDQAGLDLAVRTTGAGVDIDVVSTGTGGITVGAGDVTLDAQDAAITDRTNDSLANISSTGSVTLTAADFIGSVGNALDLTASNLSATSTTGSVTIDYTGAGTLQADTISAATGSVTLTSTSGSFLVDSISADTLVTLTASGGSIDETAGDDAAADIVAATIDIDSADGVGGTTALEITAANIDINNTGTGDINLNSLATEAVTVTGLVTATGSIAFQQSGGFGVSIDDATSTNGGGVTDSIVLGNAGADLTITNAAIGGTGDISVATSGSGDINVGLLAADGDSVTLNSAANIVDDAGDAAADIIASAATLDAVNAIDIDTNITTLTGSSTGTGDVTISEADDIDLGAFTNSDGLFQLATTSAGAITTSGDITATTVSIASTDSNISIGNTVTGSGGVTIDAGTGTFTNLTGATGGVISNGGSAASIDMIADAFDLQTGGAVDSAINAGTGTVSFVQSTAATEFFLGTASGVGIEISNTELATISAGEVSFGDGAAGAFTVGDVDLGASDITLVSGSTIDDTGAGGPHLATSGTLTLTSGGAVGGGSTLDTDASVIDVTATGGNAVNITDAGTTSTAFSAGSVAQVGAVTMVQAANGIDVDTINSSSTVDLSAAAGAITDADGNSSLAGTTVTLTAQDGIGASGLAINTTATSLDASVTAAGDLYIAESDGIDLLDVDTFDGLIDISTGGATTVTDVAAGDADASNDESVNIVAASGNIEVDTLSVAGTGDASVTATTGAITDADTDSSITADAVTLTAASGIGASAARINTTATSIDASVTALGDLYLNETDAVALVDVDTVDGLIDIVAGGNITANDVAVGDADASNDETLALLATSGNIEVDTLFAAGSSDVSLTASIGSIVDADGNSSVTADLVTLTAQDGIGASGLAINTTANSLDASVTAAGDLYLAETDGVNLLDIDTFDGLVDISTGGSATATDVVAGDNDASGDETINVAVTFGNLEIGTVTVAGSGDVTLAATIGAILDADSNSMVTGDVLTLTAQTGIGSAGLAVATSSNSLDASVTGTGDIVLSDTGGTELTDIDTVDGSITVSSDGNLTIGDIDAASTGTALVSIQTTGGSINDATALDSTADIIADSIDLDATTGIGNGVDAELELSDAGSIAADTTGGGIVLSHVASSAVDVSSLTTDSADITFTQSGGQSLTVQSATTTTSGNITLDNDAATELGNITVIDNLSVTSGGAITQVALSSIDVSGDASFVTDVDEQSITLGEAGNDVDGNLSFTTTSAGANAANVTWVNGDPDAESDTLTVTGTSVAGNVTITAADSITLADNAIDAGSGDVTLTAQDGSIIDANPTVGDGAAEANITTTGQISLTAIDGGSGSASIGATGDGDIDLSGSSDLSLSAADDVYIFNDISLADFALTWTPSGNTFSLTGPVGGTTISITDDATNTTLTTVDNSGSNLNFSLVTTSGDLLLPDGAIDNVGAGSIALTSQGGSILDASPGADGTAAITVGDGTTAGSISLTAAGAGATIGGAGTADIDIFANSTTSSTLELSSDGNIDVSIDAVGAATIMLTGLSTGATADTITLGRSNSVALDFDGTGSGYANLGLDDIIVTGGSGNLSVTNTALTVDSFNASGMAGDVTIGSTLLANGFDASGTNGIDISTTGVITGGGQLVTADVAGTAGDISLQGSAIGSMATPLAVQLGSGSDAGELILDTSGAAGAGAAWIDGSGQLLELGALTASNANTFTISNTGAGIELVGTASTSTVTLAATTTTSGSITVSGARSFAGIDLDSAGDIVIDAALATVDETDSHSGDISLVAAGNLTGTGGSITTGDASDLGSGDGTGIASGSITASIGGSIDDGVSFATGAVTDADITTADTLDAGDINLSATSIGADGAAVTVAPADATAVLNVTTTGGAGLGSAFIQGSGSVLTIGNLTTASATTANEFGFLNNGAAIQLNGVYTNTEFLTLDIDTTTSGDIDFVNGGVFGRIEADAAGDINIGADLATADNLAGNSGDIILSATNINNASGSAIVSTGNAEAAGAVSSGTITATATSGFLNSPSFVTGNASDTSGTAATVGDIALSGGSIGSAVDPVNVLFGNGDVAGQLDVRTTAGDAYIASSAAVVVGDLAGNAGSVMSLAATTLDFSATGTYSTLDQVDLVAAASAGSLTFGQAMSVGTLDASATNGDVVVNNTITANAAGGAGDTIAISTSGSGGLNGSGSLVTADQVVAGGGLGITAGSGSIAVNVVDAIEGVSLQTGSATVTTPVAADTARVGDITLGGSTIGSAGALSVNFGVADAGGVGTEDAGVLNLATTAAAGAADIDITTTSDIHLGTVSTGAGADDVSITSSDAAGIFEMTTAITASGDNFSFAFADSGVPTADSSFNNNGFTLDLGTGSLSIIADSPTLSGTVIASGGVTVGPADANSTIGLGTGAGVFSLDDATINTLIAAGGGNLTVGALGAGAVTIDDVTVGATETLEIITGSTVNDDDDVGAAFSGGTLIINAGGDIGNLGGAQGLDLAVTNLEFVTTGAVAITEADGVALVGSSSAASLSVASGGAVTDTATASLVISGNANISGNSITLGDQAGDNFTAGSLTFNSGGSVAVTENDGTLLTGTNTANSLALTAAGTITDAAGTSLTVNGNADLTANNGTAQDIVLGDDAGDTLSLGSLTFSGNNVDIETDSNILLSGNSSAAGSLTLNSNTAGDSGSISNDATGALSVAGQASFLAESGGISLGFINNTAMNFGSVTFTTINSGGVLIQEDSAMMLTGTSMSAGSVALVTEAGGITDDGTADITAATQLGVITADGSDIVLDNGTHDFGSVAFSAVGGLVDIREASATHLDGSFLSGFGYTFASGSLNLVSGGAITDDNAVAADSLTVTGNADFTANAGASDITLGDVTNGHTFGSLTFAGNNVSMIENDAMQLAGNNSAGSLVLTAAGAITDAAGTTLAVTGNADLTANNGGTAQLITLGDDAGDTTNFGSLTFDGSAVTITEDSEMLLSGASTASSLVATASNGIVDDTTASVSVSGTASFTDTGGAGITLDDTYAFGAVTLNTAGNAVLTETDATRFTGTTSVGGSLTVNSGGDLTDTTTSSIAVTGNFDATATSIVLGNDLGDSFNAGTLTLATTGNVSITEDSASRFSGTNSIGGSMTLVANGAIDDDASGSITVANTANFNAGSGNNVTLDQAGNDFATVVITAANNVTLADANSITLGAASVSGLYDVTADAIALTGSISAGSMDLDASAAVGVISQSSGSVSVTGLATFAGQTGDNIGLNQAGNDFGSVAVTSGNNVVIRDDTGGIALAGVNASGTATITSNDGAITDAGNDTAVDISGTTVTLSATDGSIGATGANGSIDVDAATVNASTTDGGSGGGSIFLNSVSGATVVFNSVNAAGAGSDVELLADNSIGIGTITAVDAISVRATSGNIDDNSDDNVADLTAGSVTLTADAGNIGGAAPQAGIPVDLRRDIEIDAATVSLNAADGSLATAQSVAAGGITVSSTGGGVDLLATDTININSIDAGNNDDVTLVSTNGSILDHADDNLADIVANNITLTATNGDIGGTDPLAPGVDPEGDIEIDPAGTLNLNSGSVFLNDLSGADVTLNFTGSNFAYSSSANILVGLIDATGTVILNTTGGGINDATADTTVDINGTTVSLSSRDGIGNTEALEISSDSLAADVTLAGDIIISDIGGTTLATIDTAGGLVDIDSDGDLELDVVTTNGTGSITLATTAGALTDLNATASDVNGTTVTLDATTGIGASGDAINTTATTLDMATTSGGIFINETDGVDLAGVTAADFTLTANGAVTDSGSLVISGATSIGAGAGNDIVLDEGGNSFGSLAIASGRNATVTYGSALDVAAVNITGLLDMDAAGVSQVATWNAGSIDLDSSATIDLANSITTTGAVAIDGSGLTTVAAAADIVAGGAVTFGISRAGALDLAGDITTNGFGITLNRATTLAGPVTLDSVGASAGGGNVTLNSTLDGAADLAITAGSGNVVFNGNVGSTTALGMLDVSGNNITVNADLVTDSALATFTNAGTLTFANATAITAGGGLLQDGAGAVNLGADIVTTGDNVRFTSGVTLTDNISISTGSAATVRFGDTLAGGGNDLVLSTASGAGTVRFDGLVSNIASLAVTAGAADINADISAGTISLANTVDLAGNVDLASAGTLDIGGALNLGGAGTTQSVLSSGADAAITLGGVVTSSAGQSLVVRSDGDLSFTTMSLGSGNADLQVDVDGDTNFSTMTGTSISAASATLAGGADGNDHVDLDSVSTTGDILFNSAVRLDSGLDLSASAGDVRFASTFSGGQQVTIAAGDAVEFLGSVSQQGITISTSSSALFAAATTLGAGGLDLASSGDVTFNGGLVTNSGGVATIANGGTLAINAGMQLSGGLDQSGGAVTLAADVVTSGTALTLGGDVTSQGSRQLSTGTGGGDLSLAGSLDGGGNGDLSLVSGTGGILLNDMSGLASLVLSGSGGLTLSGSIDTAGLDNSAMSGGLLVDGAAAITTANTDIDLAGLGSIDALTSGSLNLDAGTATVVLPDTGNTTALSSLNITAAQAVLQDVETSGSQTYNADVQLAGALAAGSAIDLNGDLLLAGNSSLTGNTVAIDGSIDGARALAFDGNVSVAGTVGAGTALNSLTTSGAAASFGGTVTTTGVQTYNSAATFNGDLIGGSLVFNNSVSFPVGAVVISDTIDFAGGDSSVTGGGELSLVPATDGAAISIGGTSSGLVLNGAALSGYDAGLVIGGTMTPLAGGALDIDTVASSIAVNEGIDTGSGSLTLLARDGIDLRNGTLNAGELVLVAASATGTILNSGGQNSLLQSSDIVLVAGSTIGVQGQEIRARAAPGELGSLQIASGAEQSAISDPGNTLEQFIGFEGATASAIARALGLSINDNLLVTNSAQQSANREQSGGLTDEGFIDPSLFEDISLYEVLGTGIALPADQSEEGYFEESPDCDPEVEDCGSVGSATGYVMPQ